MCNTANKLENHVPPVPAWLLQGEPQIDVTHDYVETYDNDIIVKPETDDGTWDWFDHVSDADLAFLTTPRATPSPCVFYGGRLIHSKACLAMRESWLTDLPMPWGKYKGTAIGELRIDYCEWVLTRRDIDADVRAAIKHRMGR